MLGVFALVVEIAAQRARTHGEDDVVDRHVQRLAHGTNPLDAPRPGDELPRARDLGIDHRMRDVPPWHGEATAEAQPRRGVTPDDAQEMRRRIKLLLEKFGDCLEFEFARLGMCVPGVSVACLEPLVRLDR